MTRGRATVAILAGALVAVAGASLAIGYVDLAPATILAALFGADGPDATILRAVRLPRTLLALAVGACLGLSGAALQGLLRNPLADPGVIGIGPAAALGAVVALYFGLGAATVAVPLAGIAGALAAVAVLVVLARGQGAGLGLVLAGVTLAALAVALTALALNLAPNPYALSEMVFWLLGAVRDRSMADVLLAAPFMAAGAALLLGAGRGLDALALGEETAATLGVAVGALTLRVVVGTALAVGAAVAVAGSIGFVGLVVPHLLRPLVGQVPSRLLLPGALGGAVLLGAADIAVRLVPTATELHLGVVTALIGTPFLLALLLRTRSEP